jgi:hypothetical protein
MTFESYGRFDIGELVRLSAISNVNSNFIFTVYSLAQGKYLNNTGAFVSSAYNFSASKVPLNGNYIYTYQVNTTTFTQAEKLLITVYNNGPTTTTTTTSTTSTTTTTTSPYPTLVTTLLISVGRVFASTPTKITAYGTVYDAYGLPIKGESVSFTVLNSATYYDNSPTTAISAYTQTDSSGYFSIDLNRRYDYVLSISRVNYTKVVKFSTVPANVSVVEIAVGTGSGC